MGLAYLEHCLEAVGGFGWMPVQPVTHKCRLCSTFQALLQP